MINVRLCNIQSIVDAQFEFPEEKGLVQFVGNNSNGKSIFGKVLSAVVFQQLKDDEDRLPLIRDGQTHGSFSISWRDKTLGVLIHQDKNRCVYIYQEGEKDPIRRFLREDGIDAMLRKMGFLIYGKNSVCLQICETYGPMPFINTSKAVNGEITNACSTDISSENFIKNYQETFKIAKRMMNQYNTEEVRCNSVIESVGYKNYNGLQEIVVELRRLYQRGLVMPYVQMSAIKPPNCIRLDLDIVNIIDLHVPLCLDVVGDLSCNVMLNIAVKVQEINNGKCPACGRRLMEDD